MPPRNVKTVREIIFWQHYVYNEKFENARELQVGYIMEINEKSY